MTINQKTAAKLMHLLLSEHLSEASSARALVLGIRDFNADFSEDGTGARREIQPRHPSKNHTGARDGNRTHDPSLTKTVRYRCATRACQKGSKILVGSGGFEPPKLSQLIYSQSHLTALVTAPTDDFVRPPVHSD